MKGRSAVMCGDDRLLRNARLFSDSVYSSLKRKCFGKPRRTSPPPSSTASVPPLPKPSLSSAPTHFRSPLTPAWTTEHKWRQWERGRGACSAGRCQALVGGRAGMEAVPENQPEQEATNGP
eukprot:3554301-Rhodomonas_salina.2